jgi:RNA polymerase sigma factor (sigma-70 family)
VPGISAITPYEQHRDYVLAVLARRCRWLEVDEREAMLHEAYAVFLQKQRDGALDAEAMRPQQVRAYLTQTAINKAMDDGNRARRTRSVALEDAGGLEVPDQRPEVVERLERSYDADRVREIVDDLPARQQAVVKLRFFLDLSPTEIQQYLGITERVYRREVERALKALSDHVDLVRRGTSCDQRRSLILAYVAGIAGPHRVQVARRHLATCPGCAAWAGRLRGAAHSAGAVVPLPVAGHAVDVDDRWPAAIGHLLGRLRDHVAGLVVRADPATSGSALGATRPGTVAAVLAGCLTVGGTTYCAVDGMPGLHRHAPPTHVRTQARAATPAPAPRTTKTARRPEPAARTTTTTVASRSTTPKRRTASRAASMSASKASTKTARKTEVATATEFGIEASGTTAAAPAAPASKASAVASTGGGASEAAVAAEFGP